MPELFYVVFILIEKHCLMYFFVGLLFIFERLRMQTNSVFLAASFGDLFLREKAFLVDELIQVFKSYIPLNLLKTTSLDDIIRVFSLA